MDMGLPGPDAGKGGKHLILPPGYKGEVPAGYFAAEALPLAAEALHRLAGQPQPAAEHLQRHLAVERQLPGLVDDAHAAAAQLTHDLEVAQPFAKEIRHGR
jgi:hypothetical protein